MEKQLFDSDVFDIRYTDLSDGKDLKKWLADKDTACWYPPDGELDLDNFIRNWVGFSRFKASLTATFKGAPVGVATIYLMPYIKVSHVCMIYFIVDPAYRKRGVGTSLLKNIKHLAKTRFHLESMHCEIYEGCPAIKILKKCGFTDIIRQENFVDFADGPKARIIFESEL